MSPAVKKTAAKSPAKKEKGQYFYANGKRKSAIARVRVYLNGKGNVEINGKTLEDFCHTVFHQDVILSPLKLSGTRDNVDVEAKVYGGGRNAQAEAVRHGISKALTMSNPDIRTTLKKVGFLTRDSRVKERKKFGLKRARRAPQFSKR